eukprot:TRINITY_DN93_c0_g1_i2.p1 TRINITY_DN93_c0_g1~~TRINITY_DN93_c0_g1_i2.p1  ORF type:complete len:100 (+),score=15.45 TRINITY_DN93_c0_g1_i2:62-361(+)
MSAKRGQDDRVIPKAQILLADMPEAMQQAAVEAAAKAWKGDQKMDKDRAEVIKRSFDEQFEGGWHCIIGKHFASQVTHESDRLVFFSMGSHNVLLFKHG